MPQSLGVAESEFFQHSNLGEVRSSARNSKARPLESLPVNVSPLGLRVDTFAQADIFPTGMEELNQLLGGGIPRGKLTEISGEVSSGKTGLLLSILAQVTGTGEIAAYVDAFDALDPEYAQNAGVDLASLLWVRCRGDRNHSARSCERALKAADVLVQGGGIGAVVLDMERLPFSSDTGAVKVPLHSWFRLQRAVKGTPTILVVLSRSKIAGSAASLALSIERNRSVWTPRDYRSPNVSCRVAQSDRSPLLAFQHQSPVTVQDPPHLSNGRWLSTHQGGKVKSQFRGIESSAHLLRGNAHGTVTVHCRFQPEA